MRRQRWFIIWGVGLLILSNLVGLAHHPRVSEASPPSQNGCGIITNPADIGFPLNLDEFSLIQPFARPNGRFDGKLHAGEDWINSAGSTFGQPIHAIASGRVTYSDPEGWGLDKGVVILQHSLPDGTFFFSLYGHMEEVDDITFVDYGTCVQKGDVVGAIGSPRPAPHLHFEIRNFSGNAPGPGYWSVDPRLRGWFYPSQFIVNWQAWLSPAHEWHRSLFDLTGPVVPPVMRDDGVMLFIDDQWLRAYNNEGRLWQYRLADSITPIGLVKFDAEQIIIASADGRLQYWHQFGGFINEWHPNIGELDQAPLLFGDFTFIRNTEDELYIYQGTSLVRQYADIPRLVDVAQTDNLLAIVTEKPQLMLFAPDGSLLQRHAIELATNVTPAPDGGLYLRNQGVLEYVDTQGNRTALLGGLSVNRSDRALFVADNGNVIMWGINGRNRLMALNPHGEILWETDIEVIDQQILNAEVIQANTCTLVLADKRGRVITFDLATGTQLGSTLVWGTNRNQVWMGTYPTDDTLRVYIGDQLTGFNLPILTGRACPA